VPVVVHRRPARFGPATPLVVLLHGRGADEHDLIDVADRLPREYWYASIRAPVPVAGGGFTWFENRGPARPIPGSVRSSVDAFRAWLDDAVERTRPCYVFGFSAGMMMAAALLLDDPRRFAGGVLLSGALPPGAADGAAGRLDGVPIFYGRGSLDDVIPAPLVAEGERYLRERSGAALECRTYPHAHAISNRELDDIAAWLGSLA
jgi:phospholipase/carboxylesterase